MKVIEFNRQKGIYKFELEEVNTEFHSHPAVEVLVSKSGELRIETPNSISENIFFAVINANVTHKIVSKNESTCILMIECNPKFLSKIMNQYDIKLNNGIYAETITSNKVNLVKKISTLYNQDVIPMTNNFRVQECLNYLNSNSSEYKQMISILKSRTNLSESRLSHIFKEEIGISIKKYLVWSRLKKTFQLVLEGKMNMYEASLQSGFYDQAHLSKAFKQMLGLKPSEVYNSRTIQN